MMPETKQAARGTDPSGHEILREIPCSLQEIVALAWQCGYDYRAALSIDALVELQALPIPDRPTREQSVMRRMTEMDASFYAMLERTGRRPWRGLDNGDDVRAYYWGRP